MTKRALRDESTTASTSLSILRRCLKAFIVGAIGVALGGFLAVLRLGNYGGLSTFDELWFRSGHFLGEVWFDSDAGCPQVDALVPESNHALWISIGESILSDPFKSQAVSWLSGAIKIRYVCLLSLRFNSSIPYRTEVYDGMDSIGVDPRWEAFGPFHEYLADAFPGMYVYIPDFCETVMIDS
jgi:hypothetical protein